MVQVDVNKFGKVAVLMGGQSAEREISIASGECVLASLKNSGVDAHAVDVGDDVIKQLQAGEFKTVFNVLHGRGGEDGVIQAILDKLGIAYSGSGVAASELAMNKIKTKETWEQAGLLTLPFLILRDEKDFALVKEKFVTPVCVKPVFEGSSNGVSKVTDFDQLAQAYEHALKYDNHIMVEPWVEGREFSVAILNQKALPSIEICVPKDHFYDYYAKYIANSTTYNCPSDLLPEQEQQLRDLALQAFVVIGCEAWGRVDFIQDEKGKFWLVEVNTIPGMTSHSLVPMAAKAENISFDNLVLTILQAARKR